MKVRSQGVRIKHRLGPNSIKLYDKAYDPYGAVLRSEVTISVPRYFQVFRPGAGADPTPALRPLRGSTADMQLRAEVSQKALDRYCSALATVDDSSTLHEIAASVERRVRWHGHSVRALHPFEPQDHALLQAINRGEFTLNGLRNRDLQTLLYAGPAKNPREQQRRSAAVSRKLRMLRAHGLLRKLPHTHRYQITDGGRLVLNALLSAHRATVRQLTAVAA